MGRADLHRFIFDDSRRSNSISALELARFNLEIPNETELSLACSTSWISHAASRLDLFPYVAAFFAYREFPIQMHPKRQLKRKCELSCSTNRVAKRLQPTSPFERQYIAFFNYGFLAIDNERMILSSHIYR